MQNRKNFVVDLHMHHEQVAILIDRADNDASRRLESKQDTVKTQAEVEMEGPAQTAALFSLAG